MEFKEIAIKQGALLDAPVFEKHWRGRNWLAVIKEDPRSPGGLHRTFMERAKGSYYYMTDGLYEGAPVEFGADYYSSSGKRSERRWYGVVIYLSDDKLVLVECEKASQAFDVASRWEEYRKAWESGSEQVQTNEDTIDLSEVPTEVLIEELTRRGYSVIRK